MRKHNIPQANPKNAPQTYEQYLFGNNGKKGIEFAKVTRTVTCRKCGKAGGTLQHVGNEYQHVGMCPAKGY